MPPDSRNVPPADAERPGVVWHQTVPERLIDDTLAYQHWVVAKTQMMVVDHLPGVDPALVQFEDVRVDDITDVINQGNERFQEPALPAGMRVLRGEWRRPPVQVIDEIRLVGMSLDTGTGLHDPAFQVVRQHWE